MDEYKGTHECRLAFLCGLLGGATKGKSNSDVNAGGGPPPVFRSFRQNTLFEPALLETIMRYAAHREHVATVMKVKDNSQAHAGLACVSSGLYSSLMAMEGREAGLCDDDDSICVELVSCGLVVRAEQTRVESSLSAVTGERSMQCAVCQSAFTTLADLERHEGEQSHHSIQISLLHRLSAHVEIGEQVRLRFWGGSRSRAPRSSSSHSEPNHSVFPWRLDRHVLSSLCLPPQKSSVENPSPEILSAMEAVRDSLVPFGATTDAPYGMVRHAPQPQPQQPREESKQHQQQQGADVSPPIPPPPPPPPPLRLGVLMIKECWLTASVINRVSVGVKLEAQQLSDDLRTHFMGQPLCHGQVITIRHRLPKVQLLTLLLRVVYMEPWGALALPLKSWNCAMLSPITTLRFFYRTVVAPLRLIHGVPQQPDTSNPHMGLEQQYEESEANRAVCVTSDSKSTARRCVCVNEMWRRLQVALRTAVVQGTGVSHIVLEHLQIPLQSWLSTVRVIKEYRLWVKQQRHADRFRYHRRSYVQPPQRGIVVSCSSSRDEATAVLLARVIAAAVCGCIQLDAADADASTDAQLDDNRDRKKSEPEEQEEEKDSCPWHRSYDQIRREGLAQRAGLSKEAIVRFGKGLSVELPRTQDIHLHEKVDDHTYGHNYTTLGDPLVVDVDSTDLRQRRWLLPLAEQVGVTGPGGLAAGFLGLLETQKAELELRNTPYVRILQGAESICGSHSGPEPPPPSHMNFVNQLDGPTTPPQLFVIIVSSSPQQLSTALFRPGRFPQEYLVLHRQRSSSR